MSGDMFLGALLDAGVPEQLLKQTVAALNIGARLEISRVNRGGLSAIKVDVYSNGEKDLPREMYWEQRAAQSGQSISEEKHRQAHSHGHSHTHAEEPVALLEHNYALQNAAPARAGASSRPQHESEPDHRPPQDPGRGLDELRAIIRRAAIA
jgi:uncharacterized protein (DUF111 family)